MGVPVITVAGRTHAGRVGVSLMSRLGLPELIAGTAEAYVDSAVALATNPELLLDLRASLRERMRTSPLTDGKQVTSALRAPIERCGHVVRIDEA
jgi:predicted O-linked N-acetylglucosamine transferase (SPINDLY family)